MTLNQTQNRIFTTLVGTAIFVTIFAVGSVIWSKTRPDTADATNSFNYLTAIGFNSVESKMDGVFINSQKICNTETECQGDGLIDYKFEGLTQSSGINTSSSGGIILTKSGDKFDQNGNFTSRNFSLANNSKEVKITRIQVGLGLKSGNMFSLGYSADAGRTFEPVIRNFTSEQLKAQSNHTVVEYTLPQPALVNGGFAYRVALKSDSEGKTSPSLKFVRVFYEINDIVQDNPVQVDVPGASEPPKTQPGSKEPVIDTGTSVNQNNGGDNNSGNENPKPVLPLPGGDGLNGTPS